MKKAIEKKTINELEAIVELAMEIGTNDPIDWGMLSINEEDSYKLIALSILENTEFNDPEVGHIMLKASLVKVIVENFVLNLKMMEMINKNIGKNPKTVH